jgi:RNA polymerase sigma-70 factor (sigma-E family)
MTAPTSSSRCGRKRRPAPARDGRGSARIRIDRTRVTKLDQGSAIHGRRASYISVTVNIPGAATGAQSGARTDAVAELYRLHAVGLIRLALMLVGDQCSAEDVVQDAFLGLHRNWPRLRDRGSALGYVRVAVMNGCRSVLRARKRAWLRQPQHEAPLWSADSTADVAEDRRVLLAAVARLPDRQRQVLALRYYADLSDSEIASVLQVSRGTVSSTASRALGALARQLKEEQ